MISGILLDQQRACIRFVLRSRRRRRSTCLETDVRAFTIDFGLLVVLSITVLSLLYRLPLPLPILFNMLFFSCAHLISNTSDDGSVEPSRLAETVPVTQDYICLD